MIFFHSFLNQPMALFAYKQSCQLQNQELIIQIQNDKYEYNLHFFSPYNIASVANIKVTRLKKMITN